MTRDKDRKRLIRNRMTATGESYTTARRHVVARAAKRSQPPAAASTPSSSAARSAIAGMSDDKIRTKTGHAWQDWVRLLDAEGAATMAHRDIARLVHDKYGVGDWWSQTVTVGYERLKGRRERGQRLDGAYEVSKSKTFSVPVAVLFAAWSENPKRRRWLAGIDAAIRTATPPKSMRLQWPDGTIVAVWFTSKGVGKSVVALAHTKLASKAAMEKTKAEWSARLDALAQFLGAEDVGLH
jgi:hypothetical protein